MAEFDTYPEAFDTTLLQPLDALPALRAACHFRSALALAEDVRAEAKSAGRLFPYLRASLESMSLSRPMLDPMLGKQLAIESINLLQNGELARAFQSDFSENDYRRIAAITLPVICEHLCGAIARESGFNSPLLMASIAQGMTASQQFGNAKITARLREYSTRILMAGDDLEMALRHARAIASPIDQPSIDVGSDVRWRATYDEAEALLLNGDPLAAREAAHRAMQRSAQADASLASRLKSRMLLQSTLMLMRASNAVIDREMSAFVPLPQGEEPPPGTEDVSHDIRRGMLDALTAGQSGDHTTAAGLLVNWDQWLFGRGAIREWFEMRLRLIAIQQMADSPQVNQLVTQLEQKAGECRDFLTLRRLRLLVDGPPPALALPLAAPLSRGPAVPRVKNELVVKPLANSTLLPTIELLYDRLAEEMTTSGEAKRTPSTASIIDDLLAISPADVIEIADANQLLLLLASMVRWASRDIIAWAWASQLHSQFPRDGTTLNLLATLGYALRNKESSPLANELAAPNLAKMFEQSLDIDTQTAANYARAASFYLAVGDFPAAEHCLLRASRLDRADAWTALRLADLYTRSQRVPDALAVLDATLRAGGQSPDVLWEASLAAVHLERYETALGYLDRLETVRPGGAWVQYYRAISLLELGRPAEAATAIDREQSRSQGAAFHLLAARASLAAAQGKTIQVIDTLSDAMDTKLSTVTDLAPITLAGCLGRLWKASAVLPNDADSPSAARSDIEDRCLASGLVPVDLFTHHRKQWPAQPGLAHFVCTIIQPLDATWADHPARLASQTGWKGYRVDYGVLATDEHEATQTALFWQLRCGMPLAPEIESFRREPDKYGDHPGITWRSYPQPVE